MVKREKTFGRQLRSLRALAGLSQEALANEMASRRAIAPTQRDVSLYESGGTLPRADKLAALVDALEITEPELMVLVKLAGRWKKPEKSKSMPKTAPAKGRKRSRRSDTSAAGPVPPARPAKEKK